MISLAKSLIRTCRTFSARPILTTCTTRITGRLAQNDGCSYATYLKSGSKHRDWLCFLFDAKPTSLKIWQRMVVLSHGRESDFLATMDDYCLRYRQTRYLKLAKSSGWEIDDGLFDEAINCYGKENDEEKDTSIEEAAKTINMVDWSLLQRPGGFCAVFVQLYARNIYAASFTCSLHHPSD